MEKSILSNRMKTMNFLKIENQDKSKYQINNAIFTKILSSFNSIITILLFVCSISASAQTPTLIGNYVYTTKGSGVAGAPNFSWNIPAGKNRVMIVTAYFEREHASLGQNYPAVTADDVLPLRVGSINSNDYYYNYRFYGQIDNIPSTAYISSSIYTYRISDLQNLPTGNTNFSIPYISNTKLPQSVGDDVVISVAVFENASQARPSVASYIGNNFDSPSYGTNFSTLTQTAPPAPVGTLQSNIVYVAYGGITEESILSNSAGWTDINTGTSNNNLGQNYSIYPNSDVYKPFNEPDGNSMKTIYRSGVIGNPTVNFARTSSTKILTYQGRMTPVLPLARPSITGTVFNDTSGPATIQGTGSNAGGLYVNVIDSDNKIVYSAIVSINGSYTVPQGYVMESGVYNLQLSKNSGAIGSLAPTKVLPTGWLTVGESNTSVSPYNSDGTNDGATQVTVGTSNITEIRFGITFSDLRITKAVNNSSPIVGSNVVFTITAINNGSVNDTGVSVQDLLPAGYAYVSHTASNGNGTYNQSTGLWTIGNLNSSATQTLSITATLNSIQSNYQNIATITGNNPDINPANNTAGVLGCTNGSNSVNLNSLYTVTVPAGASLVWFTTPDRQTGTQVSDPTNVTTSGYYYAFFFDTANNCYNTSYSSASVNVIILPSCPRTDLAVTKTVNNSTPNINTNVTFTITATNNGPNEATGVNVADSIPAGYTLVSVTPSVGTSWTAPNWIIGNLANGASAILNVVATVNASGSYTNTATITGNGVDPTPVNNTSTVTPIPVNQANVGIVKTVNNANPNVGSNVIFTLTANNAGPSAAVAVSVTDVLPAGYTYVSNTAPTAGSFASGTGIWTIGTMTNGTNETITITATVNASGSYANTATITTTTADPTPGNNTSTVTPTPVNQANVGIVKTVNNATPNVGSNVIFTLTANNAGPSAAAAVSVTDVLPAGYTYVSSTAPTAGTFASGTGIWTIGTMANGANETITITATVNASGSYANTATITTTTPDPTPGNNTSTVTPTPANQANVGIVKTVNNATPNVGSNVIFTLTANNAGPSAAAAVSVTDVLPAGYTYVSNTAPTAGTFASGTGIWTIGTMANGASATMKITATVNAAGSYSNTATITTTTVDPDTTNNTSTVVPIPAPRADLAVTKVVSNPIPNTGNTITFTITATNNGPSNATGVNVTDNIPAGYTVTNVVPSIGTWTAPTWAIGNFSVGATATLTVTAVVNTFGSYSNTATILGSQPDPNTTNNTSTSIIRVIDAVNDTFALSNGVAGSSNVGNIFPNDVLNGLPVNLPSILLSSVPTGPLTILPNGNVSVASNTPTGTYYINYTICETANPTHCDTATVTVVVINNVCDISGTNPDSDKDLVSNHCDVDDDNDGVLDTVENECLNAIIAGYPANTIAIKPSNFGIAFTGTAQIGLNLTADLSSLFGYATPGKVIVTITNANIHPIADEFYVRGDLPVTNWEVNGAIKSILGIAHGSEYFSYQRREIILYNNLAGIVNQATVGSSTTWQKGLLGNTYFVQNTSNSNYVGLTAGSENFVALLDYSDKRFGLYTSDTGLGRFSTYFVNLYPECDNDKDGIPNRLDLDSDNDGCSDANEYYGSATADGGDNGVYGLGSPTVNTNGQVSVASYAGTYTNATTATQISISAQPANVTQNIGGTAVFTAVSNSAISTTTFIAGVPNYTIPPATNVSSGLTYQWQQSTNNGTTWTNISNGGQFSGANTNSLTVSNITFSQNLNQFQIVIHHATQTCPAISNAAILNVNSILAENDQTITPVNGILGGDAGINVYTNDTLGVVGATPSNVTLTSTPTSQLSINPATGLVTVTPGTPAGTYTITYEICETALLPVRNCDTATVTVNVVTPACLSGSVAPNLNNATNFVSVNNAYTIPCGYTTANLSLITASNKPAPANVILTWHTATPATALNRIDPVTAVTNATRKVYAAFYDTNALCFSGTKEIVIYAPICAILDDYSSTPVTYGVPATLPTIYGNDTYNGLPFTMPNPTIVGEEEIWHSSVILNPNGTLTVNPTLPVGTYNLYYEICDSNPDAVASSNCSVAQVIIVVVPPPSITVTKEGIYVDSNTNGYTNAGDTITYNFVVTNTGNVTLTNVNINDAILGLTTIAVTPSTLLPGQIGTASASYIITPANILAGQVDNLAVVTGTPPAGPNVSATSTDPTPCTLCTPIDPTCTTCTITTFVNTTNAIDDINITFANTPVTGNVFTNDFDLEGNTQVITSNTTPANGAVVINPTTGVYTYTPNTGYTGVDTFTYTICDNGVPQACDTATVTINVEPVATPAGNTVVANNDAIITETATAITIPVLANDFDPQGNPFTITPGSVTTPANGTVVVNPNGTITYTPNPAFEGEDTFTYQICDTGVPQACDTATVIVTVLPVNTANTTYAIDDSYFINCSSNSSMNLLSNDYDLEGNQQTISTTPVIQPLHGTVVIYPNGTFVYTPNTCYTGPDSFIYQVCDNGIQSACDKATVYLLINKPVLILPENGASTVACASEIEAPVVPTVMDNCGNILTASAPVISTVPTCEGDVTYTYTFTDCEGNAHNWVYTFTIERADFAITTPNGASTVACASEIEAPIVPTVTDNCGNVLTASAPVISTVPTCEGDVTYTYTFTDCEGNTHNWVHTFTIERADFAITTPNGASTVACASAIVAPTVPTVTDNCGNVLTASAPVISTVPTCEGDITYTYTFTDCEGNAHNWAHTFTIERADFAITTPNGASTVACASAIVAPTVPTVTDNCGNILTASAPVISATPACEGTVTYTYTFTDCEGNAHNWAHAFTIERAYFAITTPNGASTVACASEIEAPTVPTVTDNCGNVLTASAPVISATPACEGTVTYTYTFTDCEGNAHDWVYAYAIDDTIAPTGTAPANITGLQCISDVPAADISLITDAADNCSGLVTITVSDADNGGSGCFGSPYVVTRTYTLTDCSGLSANLIQTITVQDTTAPLFAETAPADATVDCSAVPAAVILTATDNCGTATVAMTEVSVPGACAGDSIITRTWTATDSCGNTASVSQLITVEDSVAPTTNSTFDAEINVTCAAITAAPDVQFSDACSLIADTAFDEAITNQTATGYTIIRTWTASDGCGNVATVSQTVNVAFAGPIQTISAELCIRDLPIDLSSLLDPSVGTSGTWVDMDNSGGLSGSTFDPAQVAAGSYLLSYVTADGDCQATIEVNMNVTEECTLLPACTINVHNALTPDGDGLNDYLQIDGIDCYPKNRMEIFNRWGVKVYGTDGYNNNDRAFRGYSEGRTTISADSQLPTGTYFYILNYEYSPDGSNARTIKKSGYLYINSK